MAPRWLLVSDQPAFWHLDAARGPSTPSFDDLVGDGEHARRNSQPERLGRFHVDDQVKLGRLHNRKIPRLITLENPPSVDPNLMIGIPNAWSVAHQATSRSVFGIGIERR